MKAARAALCSVVIHAEAQPQNMQLQLRDQCLSYSKARKQDAEGLATKEKQKVLAELFHSRPLSISTLLTKIYGQEKQFHSSHSSQRDVTTFVSTLVI